MRYEAKTQQEDGSSELTFRTKKGESESIYLGRAAQDGDLAGRCLEELYDYHQVNDEFEQQDQIVVDGKWTFEVYEQIHITPADEETRHAVLGITRELPYRIAYSASDGRSSQSFATLEQAAEYVKARWQGADYMDSTRSFHTDFAQYVLIGFALSDLGTYSVVDGARTFVFKGEQK